LEFQEFDPDISCRRLVITQTPFLVKAVGISKPKQIVIYRN
jgi:hypothetical protein